MSDWEKDLPGRERSPEELFFENEANVAGGRSAPSPVPENVIKKTWSDMRRLKPELYVVFRAWSEVFQLRDTSTHYSHEVYRGFYAEMARRLGLTDPAIRHRLGKAKHWFANRLENNQPNAK